jgi:nucleotide-binding universal stress UspA family protein
VVCAIDAAPGSRQPVHTANSLARALDSRLVVLHAGAAGSRSPVDVAVEERADLLIVGPPRGAPLGSPLVGGGLRDLLRRSPCPVVVVPRPASRGPDKGFEPHATPGSIVCGIAGSGDSLRTARVATDLGSRLGLRSIVVHAHSPDAGDSAATRAWSLLGRVVGSLDDAVEGRFVLGDPAQMLQAMAKREQSSLIAIGPTSAGALQAILCGSVGARLAAEATTPVVIVPRGVRRWPHRRDSEVPARRA